MTFEQAFGESPSHHAIASGRVNLIGEHTDYNGGYVLPTLIPQTTRIALRARNDREVHWLSPALEAKPYVYRLGEETARDHWADYAAGVTKILAGEGFDLRGFDALVESEVPIGSGLSSSAALEVALMKGLREMNGLRFDDVRLARLCQRVENEFVGARVGIMDPMAIALGNFGEALFIDTRSLDYRKIRLPLDRMDLVVIHSGVSHRNVGGGYNQRRAECEAACRELGISSLRELEEDPGRVESLPEPLRRRARHVVTENARVLAAVSALTAGDCQTLGTLFHRSHVSLRDDYEVSVPEVDALVEVAMADRQVFGARITGGGFGGSVVILAHPGAGHDVAQRVTRTYRERTAQEPHILLPS